MLSKFDRKSAEIDGLRMAYAAIEGKIKVEREYNHYYPKENEELANWQKDSNDLCEIRVAVYRDILRYIEKKI